jgi:hypothetical protein
LWSKKFSSAKMARWWPISLIKRKHTSGLDVGACVDASLDAFFKSLGTFNSHYERLRSWRLTRSRANSLAVELALAGAIASSDILPVIREFNEPRHEVFRERTGWAFYNAATEAALKRMSPPRQVQGFRGLNDLPHVPWTHPTAERVFSSRPPRTLRG